MLSEMDSFEMGEWRAFARIEPLGEAAADLRHGIATAVLANVNRDSKRRPEPYTSTDFIPWADAPPQEGELSTDPDAQSRLIKQKLFKHKG